MNLALAKIGDFQITFQQDTPMLLERSSKRWRILMQNENTGIWLTEPDENWCGFPLQTYQDTRWQIWMLGEFFGVKPNFPDAVINPGNLNGHFILFAYEHQLRQWHVVTNRFGTVHAYLADDGKHRAVGTFSPAVAQAVTSKQLDWYGLAGFFTFGFFLGEDTYWQDVRILPPASHITLDVNGRIISHEKTWTWEFQPDPKINSKIALNEFRKTFEIVVQDQVRGKSTALPISGGLDSRSTLIPLTGPTFKNAVHLFPFSYGYTKDSTETAIAGQLADKRDLDLRTWTIQPYLFDNIEWIMSAVEGFQDTTLCRQAYVVKDLSQTATHVLAAHWGDVWLDDMGFLDADASLPNDVLAQKLVRKFTKNGSQHLLTLFRDVIPNDAKTKIEANLSDDLQKLNDIKNVDFRVKAWKTQNWSFRWTLASLRMYQTGLFPLLPFYDHRLTNYFMTLRSEMVSNRMLQINYIKHYAPDLAKVPWQPYDANLYQYRVFNSWLLPKRAFTKLVRSLRGRTVIERNWEVQFLNPQGRMGLERWLLTPGLKLHDMIKPAILESYLHRFFAHPDASNGYAVSMLLTFSAWLEQYG